MSLSFVLGKQGVDAPSFFALRSSVRSSTASRGTPALLGCPAAGDSFAGVDVAFAVTFTSLLLIDGTGAAATVGGFGDFDFGAFEGVAVVEQKSQQHAKKMGESVLLVTAVFAC